MQLSQRPAIFKAASNLFLNEYILDEDEDVRIFLKYLTGNWFEGYNYPNNVGSTSNNNDNKSVNDLIKREDT